MANVTKRIENDTLYFELEGRIDTTNANQIDQTIQNLKSDFITLNLKRIDCE